MKELIDRLNRLRLPGIKESIDYRLQEAIKDNMAHQDLLTLLFEDEAIYRDNQRSKALCKKAKFKDKVLLEQFDVKPERGVSKTMIKQMQSLKFMELFENIIFTGGTGAGKSFLAQAIGHTACLAGKESIFTSVNLLFTEINCAEQTGGLLKFFQKMAKVQLLILDDFALRSYTHHEATMLYQLLEDRYQKASTIVTTQVRPDGWKSLFEDPVIADAICDRLISCAHTIHVKNDSYRGNYAPKEKINVDA